MDEDTLLYDAANSEFRETEGDEFELIDIYTSDEFLLAKTPFADWVDRQGEIGAFRNSVSYLLSPVLGSLMEGWEGVSFEYAIDPCSGAKQDSIKVIIVARWEGGKYVLLIRRYTEVDLLFHDKEEFEFEATDIYDLCEGVLDEGLFVDLEEDPDEDLEEEFEDEESDLAINAGTFGAEGLQIISEEDLIDP